MTQDAEWQKDAEQQEGGIARVSLYLKPAEAKRVPLRGFTGHLMYQDGCKLFETAKGKKYLFEKMQLLV